MTKFVVNDGFSERVEVEAADYNEEGSFVVFTAPDRTKVLAMPTARVYRVSVAD
ncbi:hypothetical protein [Isoptericola sp. NPDC055881]